MKSAPNPIPIGEYDSEILKAITEFQNSLELATGEPVLIDYTVNKEGQSTLDIYFQGEAKSIKQTKIKYPEDNLVDFEGLLRGTSKMNDSIESTMKNNSSSSGPEFRSI